MLIHNDIVRSGVVMSATPERTFCVIYNQLWFMRFIAPKSAGNLLNRKKYLNFGKTLDYPQKG